MHKESTFCAGVSSWMFALAFNLMEIQHKRKNNWHNNHIILAQRACITHRLLFVGLLFVVPLQWLCWFYTNTHLALFWYCSPLEYVKLCYFFICLFALSSFLSALLCSVHFNIMLVYVVQLILYLLLFPVCLLFMLLLQQQLWLWCWTSIFMALFNCFT